MSQYHDVIVIGGGISGLATAWWLHARDIDVVVLEKESVPGGTMQTATENGWMIETGPNSALETTPLFRRLFSELGIEADVLYANREANNRYILKDGTLHSLPMSPGAFLKTDLFSFGGKIRILKEPFIGKARHEESVGEFVERRLGREFLDYAINPFVAGVFAGNPEDLSVRTAFPKLYALEEKYGGLVRGMIGGRRERKKRAEKAKDRARMFSFQNGMETLPCSIAGKLGDRFVSGCTVRNVKLPSGQTSNFYAVEYENLHGRSEVFFARSIVLAVPAEAAEKLLDGIAPDTARAIGKIYYPPVAEVFLGYRNADIPRPLDGFGFLIPARERRKILGTIWSSAIFPNRAPIGFAALTTFVGGSRQPEILDGDDDALIGIVRNELQSIMGIRTLPTFIRIHRWRKAIPQYNRGYQAVLDSIDAMENSIPGLFICSNFRGGISVSDCIINADRTSDKVHDYLSAEAEIVPREVSVL